MTGIDPKWAFWLGVVIFLEQGVGQGTVKLTNVIPDAWIPFVVAWCALLAWVGGAIQTALIGYSSKDKGPLTSVAKVAIMVTALAASLFAFSGDARAQGRPKLTGNIAADIAAATAKPSQPVGTAATNTLAGVNFNTIGQKLQALAKDVIDKGIADLTAASTDAQNHNDQIAKPCWDAQAAFLKQLPSEWQTPPTEIGPALAIQISRDLLNTITGNDATSLKVACAALIGDQITIINQTLSIIGVAGIAGLPAGL